LVTGPSREHCPANCTGWQKFRLAFRAILYHELALLASGLAIVAVTWQSANQIGALTFLVLWTMRLSSKLNLFLGVESLNTEFLPQHLAFIGSFFTKARMNGLFPISITASTATVVLLMAHAWRADTSAYESIGFTLLGTLLALAVLVHVPPPSCRGALVMGSSIATPRDSPPLKAARARSSAKRAGSARRPISQSSLRATRAICPYTGP
jgi:putative photosynthetic complex assembly protein 2